MDDATALRLATIAGAVIIVIVGGSIANGALRARNDQRWWVVIAGLAVAVFTIYAGWDLFDDGYFSGY